MEKVSKRARKNLTILQDYYLLAGFQAKPLPENSVELSKLKATVSHLAVPENHVDLVLKLPGTSKTEAKTPANR